MEKLERLECEGSCVLNHGEHDGEVKECIIQDNSLIPKREWVFNYCENAIKTDLETGFDVYVKQN